MSKEYGSLTVAQLKELLEGRGLPVSGRKADLVKRLQDADAATEGLAEESEPVAEIGDIESVEPKRQGGKGPRNPERSLASLVSWTEGYGPRSGRNWRQRAQEEAVYRLHELQQALGREPTGRELWRLLENAAFAASPALLARGNELIVDAVSYTVDVQELQEALQGVKDSRRGRKASAALRLIRQVGKASALVREAQKDARTSRPQGRGEYPIADIATLEMSGSGRGSKPHNQRRGRERGEPRQPKREPYSRKGRGRAEE